MPLDHSRGPHRPDGRSLGGVLSFRRGDHAGSFGREVAARGSGGVLHGVRLQEPGEGRGSEDLPGTDRASIPAAR